MSEGMDCELDRDDDSPYWWRKIPREVWAKCFEYLTPTDLNAVAQICHQFSDIASDKIFWRNVNFGRFTTFHHKEQYILIEK